MKIFKNKTVLFFAVLTAIAIIVYFVISKKKENDCLESNKQLKVPCEMPLVLPVEKEKGAETPPP